MVYRKFIPKAIELAIASGKKGNNTFGTVLVHDGEIIASAENTEVTGNGFGHAESNLAVQVAQEFPDAILGESTFFTSATPCPCCSFAILALGVKRIVISVSYDCFAKSTGIVIVNRITSVKYSLSKFSPTVSETFSDNRNNRHVL